MTTTAATSATSAISGQYLLEVRAEEIPARMLTAATKELATRVFEELVARNLTPSEVRTGFTPRRLVLILDGLPGREPDREEEVMGPPVGAAYAADGTPKPALEGFAKRAGVAIDELRRVKKDKGEYVVATRRIAGRATGEVLAELVPRILGGIGWAKTMRWGSGEAGAAGPWVRPVHGIVSLLDGAVVPFPFFDVTAGDTTVGHPVLSPQPFAVAGADAYVAELAARGVVVRMDERRERLRAGMAERAAQLGGTLVDDPELLDKLASICEIPGVMEGGFDPALLALPREVLQTSLRDHQSALTAVGPDGNLLPVFLTVMDRPDDPIGRVRSGNEWVVAARLADARFFYGEDRKAPLASRSDRLRSLGFHEKLGSYAAKTERLVALAETLADAVGRAHLAAPAREAAALLKVDLVTEMVREFTSLQGVMGGVYAREDGAPEPVWQAVYDQYLPASTADPIPRGEVGRIVGLADRLDTLVGMFGLGLVPSGSKDPFGLRRAAQGVVRILLEGDLPLDLERATAAAAALYGDALKKDAGEIWTALRPFLEDRVRYLVGLRGFAHDEIEAALATGMESLPDLLARVDALHRVREEEGFRAVVLAAKRIANILREAPESALEPEALREPAEQALHTAAEGLRGEVEEATAARAYDRAFAAIARLAPVLDRFFVEILVMDPDPAVRGNRLALLRSIHRIVSRTARLTDVVVERAA